jgi:hypothetical protein
MRQRTDLPFLMAKYEHRLANVRREMKKKRRCLDGDNPRKHFLPDRL